MQTGSQTQFAILGLLEIGPMSGYDLKKLVDASVGHFWREGWGRIYPTLHALETARLVARRSEGKAGGRERQVYRLLPAGRRRLREWTERDWTPEVYRNELLLKIFFGRSVSTKTTRRHVERFRSQCATEIAAYRQVLRSMEKEHAQHPDAPYWKMTVSYGLHRSRALEAWAAETLEELNSRTDND